jgi:Tfp pilus assembly protein PilN
MRAVNLLPRDAGQKQRITKENVPVVAGVCAGVLIAAVLASQFLSQSGKVAAERQQLADLQAQLDALPAPPPGPTAAQTKLVSEQSTRLTALTAALQTRVAWDRVLREFSLVLPDDVWLRSLNLDAPTSPATAGALAPAAGTTATPTGLTIDGSTYSHDAVARLLSRLALVPDLTNVQLVNSAAAVVGRRRVVNFSIAADIKPPADAKGSS